MPQFISKGDPVFAKSVLLAAIFVAIGLSWLLLYANLVDVIGRSLRFRRIVEALSGVVLIGLGVRLAIER